MEASHEANVVGPGGAHRVQKRLHSGRGEGRAGKRPAVEPCVIPGRISDRRVIVVLVIRLVVEVKDDRGIVGVGRGHRAPKGDGVGVRHGLLARGFPPSAPAGGGGRGGSSRPVQVQDDIGVFGGAETDDLADRGLVGGGGGRAFVVGIAAAEPIVLVQGKADDAGFPSGHRFLGHLQGTAPVAVRRPITRRRKLQTIHVHSIKMNRAAAGGLEVIT